MSEPNSTTTAAIWGATGATGIELLHTCLADRRFSEIRVFTRRPIELGDPTLRQIIVPDFLDLSSIVASLEGVDVAYWCLGVSQLAVPDESRYREITLHYALVAARALVAASPSLEFHFLSGMGADPKGTSMMMWARIKGETETALSAVGFDRLLIWRPAYIHVVRGRKSPSLAERLFSLLYPILRFIPGMVNTTAQISRAMLQVSRAGGKDLILSPTEINRLASQYRPSPQ